MKNNNKPPSYHKSLDHLVFIPGIGHVAPDTYSGYGSLLDSDVDDDNEATSSFYADSISMVPDSIPVDVPEICEKLGFRHDEGDACFDEGGIYLRIDRSGSVSPNTKRFNKFCANIIEKERKKAAENVKKAEEKEKGNPHIGYDLHLDSVDMSPKSKKFQKFYLKALQKYK